MTRNGEARERVGLQVAAAQERDAGRGIARLSSRILRELGLGEGDVIEIAGKQRVSAAPGSRPAAP